MAARTIIWPLALALAACIPLSGVAEERMLSGEELKVLYSNVTGSGLTKRDQDWTARYKADGSYTIEVPAASFSDAGKWWVEGDTICTKRGEKAKGCNTIYHVKDNDYVYRDDRGEGRNMMLTK